MEMGKRTSSHTSFLSCMDQKLRANHSCIQPLNSSVKWVGRDRAMDSEQHRSSQQASSYFVYIAFLSFSFLFCFSQIAFYFALFPRFPLASAVNHMDDIRATRRPCSIWTLQYTVVCDWLKLLLTQNDTD